MRASEGVSDIEELAETEDLLRLCLPALTSSSRGFMSGGRRPILRKMTASQSESPSDTKWNTPPMTAIRKMTPESFVTRSCPAESRDDHSSLLPESFVESWYWDSAIKALKP